MHDAPMRQRQVSLDVASNGLQSSVIKAEVPMPDYVPSGGALVRVKFAGVCFRSTRSMSTNSLLGGSSIMAETVSSHSNHGVRDTSLYPGFEVAGVIQSLGSNVNSSSLHVGDNVIIYPYTGCPDGYVEILSVEDVKYLIKVPDSVPMPVAAMLPSGGLWAMNTIFTAREHIDRLKRQKGNTSKLNVLIVGTGGLALWAIRVARHFFPEWDTDNSLKISVAVLRDEGLKNITEQHELRLNYVQWHDNCYEDQLIERTISACDGLVDIVIDFAATSRSLKRSLRCLEQGGAVLIGSNSDRLKVDQLNEHVRDKNQTVVSVEMGTLDQLRSLVNLIENDKIEPPPYSLFPVENLDEVFSRLGKAEICGRALIHYGPLH